MTTSESERQGDKRSCKLKSAAKRVVEHLGVYLIIMGLRIS